MPVIRSQGSAPPKAAQRVQGRAGAQTQIFPPGKLTPAKEQQGVIQAAGAGRRRGSSEQRALACGFSCGGREWWGLLLLTGHERNIAVPVRLVGLRRIPS